jgi:hypothetical protein
MAMKITHENSDHRTIDRYPQDPSVIVEQPVNERKRQFAGFTLSHNTRRQRQKVIARPVIHVTEIDLNRA